MSVDHYENFPVASWLCPPALRAPIVAIYRFARTADDLADEGGATPAQRRCDLLEFQQEWQQFSAGNPPPRPRWPAILQPLVAQQQRWQLPAALLNDLLSAFLQDVDNPVYADRAALLDYCQRSANPVGRLLLHLYGITEAPALRASDRICTALQLINFWQDLSVDLPRGRCYVPTQDLQRHGAQLQPGAPSATLPSAFPGPAEAALLADLLAWATAEMHAGAALVHMVGQRAGWRAGWELRLVVQGGLRVAEKIAALRGASLVRRPRLYAADLPRLLLRAGAMRPHPKAVA